MVEEIQAVEITALADTYGRHEELPDIDTDVLVFAGDLTQDGGVGEVKDFNRWLGGLDVEHRLVVAGNHDQCLIGDGVEPKGLLSNATYLEDEKAEIGGAELLWYALGSGTTRPTFRPPKVNACQDAKRNVCESPRDSW